MLIFSVIMIKLMILAYCDIHLWVIRYSIFTGRVNKVKVINFDSLELIVIIRDFWKKSKTRQKTVTIPILVAKLYQKNRGKHKMSS